MSENQVSRVLSLNPTAAAVIKGSVISHEKNSKGISVSWQRLRKEEKENPALLTTSKNFVEYAATRPAVHFRDSFQWLLENSELSNVQEWFSELFDRVNRPILQEAGASSMPEAKLIGDIESLVAFETLESRRGRAASRLNGDQWKVLSPLLSACLFKFFTVRKNIPEAGAKSLTNKYLNIANGVLVAFKPVGEDAHGKLDEMLEFAFEELLSSHPDLESLLSFMIAVSLKNREEYAVDVENDYGY